MKKIRNLYKKIINKIKTKKVINSINNYKMTNLDKKIYNLLVLSHCLEKDLLVKEKINKNIVSILFNDLCYVLKYDYSIEKFEIRESASIIYFLKKNKYIDLDLNIEEIINKYNIRIIENVGVKKQNQLIFNDNNKTFISSRDSVRFFTKKIIDRETIEKIIFLANNCASACNRQPCRVIYGYDEKSNNIIRKYVPDKMTSKNIYNFMVLVCEKNLFNNIDICQEFFNSGIFLDSLLLSIHSYNLGACPFQCSVMLNNEKMKSDLNLSKSEIVMCFIGFGEIDFNKQVLCSARRGISEIAIPLKVD